MKVKNILKKLISIESVSGNEKRIQKFIFDYLDEIGFKPLLVKGNVMVKIDGRDKRNAIIFNAHVDTVSAGDLSRWEYPPFSGKISDGKMYGLGASDEKAGIASLLLLAEKLTKSIPRCDVWFHFVTKEELDGSGTKNTLDWFMKKHSQKYSQLAGVLVEPTGLEEIEIGHKGNVFVKLSVKGDSGHGSRPEQVSTNAVLLMCEILQKLPGLGSKWKEEFADDLLGTPSIGIGTSIKAGRENVPNKFADNCVATLDIRTTPVLHGKVLKLLKIYLEDYAVSVDYLYNPASYGLTDEDDKIVKSFKKVIPKIRISVSEASTDQCFFTKYGIPAVIFGPGEKNCIHKPNEFCILDKIGKGIDVYEQLIKEWSKMV